MSELANVKFAPINPAKLYFYGGFPRCGNGKLVYRFLKLKADAGYGPAVFRMLIVGFFVIGLTLWFDASFALSLWLPLTVIIPLFLLLKLKVITIALQYCNNTSACRLDRD